MYDLHVVVVVIGAADEVHTSAHDAGGRQPPVHVRQAACSRRAGVILCVNRQAHCVCDTEQRPVSRQACTAG
jgi:hypothetical protein